MRIGSIMESIKRELYILLRRRQYCLIRAESYRTIPRKLLLYGRRLSGQNASFGDSPISTRSLNCKKKIYIYITERLNQERKQHMELEN